MAKIELVFEIFRSNFGAAVAKIFNNYKEIPKKNFLETLSLFSQPEFPEKDGIYQI